MSSVEIFGFAPSTYVRTARMVCAEKGIGHTLSPLEFRADSHAKLHPFLKMPAMRHGEVHLFESLAIAAYVDAAFDGPNLQSTDARTQGTIMQWAGAAMDYGYQDLVQPHLTEGEPDAEQQEAENRDLALLDRQLKQSDFLAGSSLTLADLFWLPMVAFGWDRHSAGDLAKRYPNLASWYDRLSQRESFKATAP